MTKYKVVATKDVGYKAIIEADSEEEAWAIARGEKFFSNNKFSYKLPEAEWEQTDDGHDWTLETIWKVKDEH